MSQVLTTEDAIKLIETSSAQMQNTDAGAAFNGLMSDVFGAMTKKLTELSKSGATEDQKQDQTKIGLCSWLLLICYHKVNALKVLYQKNKTKFPPMLNSFGRDVFQGKTSFL
jgi:hypothetical protein